MIGSINYMIINNLFLQFVVQGFMEKIVVNNVIKIVMR